MTNHVEEEKAIGSVHDGQAVEESQDEFNHILERKYMTKKEFYWLWAGVLFQAFCSSFEGTLSQGISNVVVDYFEVISLSAVLPVILAVMSTALVPFYTKCSDVFGRAGSLTFAFTSYIVGLIIQTAAQSFLDLAIGEMVFGLGHTGIQALSQVVIADTTSLLERGIMFAMYDMGNVVNIWTAQFLIDPLTGDGEGDTWRIGYTVMTVVAAIGSISLLIPLWYVHIQLKRRKAGIPPRRSLRWLFTEFDAVGAVLITLALSMTLLPLVLARRVPKNWQSPNVYGVFAAGLVFFVLLFIWEAKFAKKPILPLSIWRNRTAFSCLMIMFLLKVLGNVVWQYLTQYFVASRNITFGDAYLLVRGFQMAWLIFQLIAGLVLKKWRRPRLLIWIGVIVYIIGVGLMIPARHVDASTFLVVFSQSVAGAGGGLAHLASTVLVTAVVHKSEIATVVGASQILVSLGSAFGNALAGGIWTQYLPVMLEKHVTLPIDETKAMNSFANYVKALEPATKAQVVKAYSESQLLMSIIGLAFAGLTLVFVALLRHVDMTMDQDTQDRLALGLPDDSDLSVEKKRDSDDIAHHGEKPVDAKAEVTEETK